MRYTRSDEYVPASSGERAASYIRRQIFDGELKPGDRVPQDQIAAALGMSKIPVREALVALEREGWVRIELNRGVFVNVIDEQVVRDQYALFGILYGFAVERAVAHADPAVVSELTQLEQALGQTDDPAEIDRLVLRFHSAVVDAARSPRLKAVLRGMSALVPGSFFSIVGAAADIERRGMATLIRAMKRGDAGAAAAAYATMMRGIADTVVPVFRDRGLFEARATPDASAGAR